MDSDITCELKEYQDLEHIKLKRNMTENKPDAEDYDWKTELMLFFLSCLLCFCQQQQQQEVGSGEGKVYVDRPNHYLTEVEFCLLLNRKRERD